MNIKFLGMTSPYVSSVNVSQPIKPEQNSQALSFKKLEKDTFERQNTKAYNDVYAHEAAHKSAAGALGGAIVVEKDANGAVTGGHVDIKMPALDTKNPDKTIAQAKQVEKAALAPSDPSGQDYKVAAQAQGILSQAEQAKKQLNVVG